LPEVICNTSPLQYLHQIGLLHILPALAGRVIVPQAVVDELAQGRAAGLNLPDPSAWEWVVTTPCQRLRTAAYHGFGIRRNGSIDAGPGVAGLSGRP